MRIQYSGITWFDNWTGREILFENLASKWKIIEKINEREIPFTEFELIVCGFEMESHGTFICINVDGCQEAVLKVRMQYATFPVIVNILVIEPTVSEYHMSDR